MHCQHLNTHTSLPMVANHNLVESDVARMFASLRQSMEQGIPLLLRFSDLVVRKRLYITLHTLIKLFKNHLFHVYGNEALFRARK